MIQVELYDAVGLLHIVPTHPIFVDFAERTDAKRTDDARVAIDSANAIAPIVAALDEQSAIATRARLRSIVERIRKLAPGRDDALSVATLLYEWASRWPEGRWSVSGDPYELAQLRSSEAEGLDKRLASDARPRYEPRYKADEALRADPVGVGDRMATAREIAIERGTEREDARGNVIDDRSLQREVRIGGMGGSSDAKGTAKKKRAAGGGRSPIEDEARSITLQARVTPATEKALKTTGRNVAEILRIVGTAINCGMTYEQAVAFAAMPSVAA